MRCRRCPRRRAALGRCAAALAALLALLALGGSGTGEELLSVALGAWVRWAGPPGGGAGAPAGGAGWVEELLRAVGGANGANGANSEGVANGARVAMGANGANIANGANGAGVAMGANFAMGVGRTDGAWGAMGASIANGAGVAMGARIANSAGGAMGANGAGVAMGANIANGAGGAVGASNAKGANVTMGAPPLLPSPPPCGHPPPALLVLVASAPAHAEQRRAVRDTWGAGTAATRTLFALGLPASPALQGDLAREAAAHGDLVQGPFADTYRNLTRKTLLLLAWAAARCPGARYVLKADDDVYVNVPALLAHVAALGHPRRLYLGRVHWRVAPERRAGRRHHVPEGLYGAAAFPPYCSGTAYVLSRAGAAAVLAAAPLVPAVEPEDAFVGLCARRAALAPRHSARVAGAAAFPPDACCYGEVLLSAHGLRPRGLRRLWRMLRDAGDRPCSALQRVLGVARCRALAALGRLRGGDGDMGWP